MSQIKASSESVRKLAAGLKTTIKNLEDISRNVSNAGNVSGWDDQQGADFKSVVKRISNLTKSPIDTLQSAIPRLNKIAAVLDQYSSVRF